MASYLNSLKHK